MKELIAGDRCILYVGGERIVGRVGCVEYDGMIIFQTPGLKSIRVHRKQLRAFAKKGTYREWRIGQKRVFNPPFHDSYQWIAIPIINESHFLEKPDRGEWIKVREIK